MSKTNWVQPSTVSAVYLSATTQPGLLQATTHGTAGVMFWVLGGEERHSIMLPNEAFSKQFEVWKLDERELRWGGIHLGPVELHVDADDITSRHDFPSFGDLLIADGQVVLIGKRPDTVSPSYHRIEVARLAGKHRLVDELVCRRWALMQTDWTGEKRIVFERRPPSDAGSVSAI